MLVDFVGFSVVSLSKGLLQVQRSAMERLSLEAPQITPVLANHRGACFKEELQTQIKVEAKEKNS